MSKPLGNDTFYSMGYHGYGSSNATARVSADFQVDMDPQHFIQRSCRIKIRCAREKKPTEIMENSKTVMFKTPSFRAEAAITLPPMTSSANYDIGWVQACSYMKFCNRYGKYGFSSWEFPQLNSGLRAVNDSSGQYFPFYGVRHEVIAVAGPCKVMRKIMVTMSDAPMSHVTLKIPTGHINTGRLCDLTEIERMQKFYIWLVAKCNNTGQVFPLRTITWDVDLKISINPGELVGRMSKLLEPKVQRPPVVLESIVEIPEEALSPPDANHAQMLVWRPLNRLSHLSLIVPPSFQPCPRAVDLENDHVYENYRCK